MTKRRTRPSIQLFSAVILTFCHVAEASLPQVDFDRMGKVGLAGAFSGLDFFDNTTTPFDATTSTLFSRSSDGALSRLASTNPGGRILAGCGLNDLFYFAGSFSSIGSVSAANVGSYSSSGSFSALGSNGPNGEIDALYCDTKNDKLWVGGKFTSPGSAVAVWDPKALAWSKAPFGGLSGAAAQVLSITSNSSDSSIFFSGSFLTSFGNGTLVNGTNNPNVPFSPGATPYSSSLVPIPLGGAEIVGSPASSDPQFSNIQTILCPSGADGPGNTWLAADGDSAVITVRKFSFISAMGVRLGNTFLSGHGTTSFTITTIPDNAVQTLEYFDPTTGQNKTCSNPCTLLTDSSILYQDFLFKDTLTITGIQVQLSGFTGASAGLHILQILSAGAFASSIGTDNGQSCFAPNPSNATLTGTWVEKQANTDIPGTTQAVLVSEVDVGTSSSNSPSFTWIPYVSASGQYDINMLVPGCANFQDCSARTTVKVIVFPGNDLDPWVSTISQQNEQDAVVNIYSGSILPSSPNFVTTIFMSLADNPAGKGEGGKYELVADRVELVLKTASGNATTGSGTNGTTGSVGSQSGFGFFEWSLSSSSGVDATQALPNTTETTLDTIGVDLLSGVGGSSGLTSSNAAISAVVHHPSGTIFLGGTFTLSSGTASGATNIAMFKNGVLTALAANGLNGPVTSLVLDGDKLFAGGSFLDTSSASTQGKLRGIAMYDVQQNQWSALDAGVNGGVTSLGFSNGQIQVTGNFTEVLSSTSGSGHQSAGFAVWDIASASWKNSGGYLVGSLTFVGNGTTPGKGQQQTQFIAGNVTASSKFGASGLVMLSNGDSSGPDVTVLGVQLDGAVDVVASTSASRKRTPKRGPSAWISNLSFPKLFSRQSTTTLTPLPAPPSAPAPAVIAGTFWTNTSSSHQVAIIGGNFSFPAASGGGVSQGVAIYDSTSGTITALNGSQIKGTVRALLVQGSSLFVGGQFTIDGTTANGLALYDLSKQAWDFSALQALEASTGSSVIVRSLTTSASKANTIIVAGSFAKAGSLVCEGICAWDLTSKQWNNLGNGIQGEVASVAYAGNKQASLIAAGSFTLSQGAAAVNVAEFSFSNSSWVAVGAGSDIPGPVTAVEVNDGNISSIFAAGQSTDGTSTFLTFWNGASWSNLGSTLGGSSQIQQLTMVPLQDTHSTNGVIEPDRMLMVSGSIVDSSTGNSSSALFDGQTFIPYITTTSSTGSPGAVSSLFHSFSTFSFAQRHFLAVGVVILISIAIAAGVVFFLALIGILWTLFSRREDKNKYDGAEEDDDDDSTHHRPSSLLEHINAATRTTILGGVQSPFSNYNTEKEEEAVRPATADTDPFAHEGGNYIRAETPSEVMGGPGAEDEQTRPSHARYSFDGTGEGELKVSAGQEVEILDDKDPAWWYARDVRTGQEGVVPAAYLY